jgi:hypothetical protein
MDPSSARATRADHGLDADDVDAHHRPVSLIRRPAYEGWLLTLCGVILIGLIGGLGWAGYVLSTVQAELRHLQAQVAQMALQNAGGEAVSEETARRLHEMDQRLHAVENWTKDTAPRLTALPRRPRDRRHRRPCRPPSNCPATPSRSRGRHGMSRPTVTC